MDPYLEEPARWPGVHQLLLSRAVTELNVLLPQRYVANLGERLYVAQPNRSVYPDVFVVEHPPPPRAPRNPESGGIATMVMVSDPPLVLTVEPIQHREVFVEILPVGDEGRVVTFLEVLSPSNKSAGSPGRELYLSKQQQVLASPTHLIEIDLLRRGEPTTAAPLDRLIEHGPWDYLVSLHRGGQAGRFEVWPILLRQRLPRIRVPLADGDPDVVLDLQTLLDRVYDDGAYARRIDYRRHPVAPLTRADADWADALLRERGLRP
jgi:hypothetical protein